ncbi:hypothetical protein Naga_100528g1 [Nannochloropsis gaditana]|uniref:Uncharacterized protein n=1 Tax=Nannochloropsis gaditana TaxID=72520 RepID=W7TPF9_9STRA|nr:hypothetical protein Naga_100528g1 [Nannochloropsis gaditana]
MPRTWCWSWRSGRGRGPGRRGRGTLSGCCTMTRSGCCGPRRGTRTWGVGGIRFGKFRADCGNWCLRTSRRNAGADTRRCPREEGWSTLAQPSSEGWSTLAQRSSEGGREGGGRKGGVEVRLGGRGRRWRETPEDTLQ